jgi:hypothetical protein
LESVSRVGPAAVHPDLAGPQQPINVALRHALQDANQEVVDALPGFCLANLQLGDCFVAAPGVFP